MVSVRYDNWDVIHLLICSKRQLKKLVLGNPLSIVNRVSETFLEKEKSICAACRYDLWTFTLKSGRFLCSSECMQLFKGARCQKKVQRHCLSLMKYFYRVKKQQQQQQHHHLHHHHYNHYHHHQQTTNKQTKQFCFCFCSFKIARSDALENCTILLLLLHLLLLDSFYTASANLFTEEKQRASWGNMHT